jgi:uncharacterized membrane protein YdbT with pleckstrin-like domain
MFLSGVAMNTVNTMGGTGYTITLNFMHPLINIWSRAINGDPCNGVILVLNHNSACAYIPYALKVTVFVVVNSGSKTGGLWHMMTY